MSTEAIRIRDAIHARLSAMPAFPNPSLQGMPQLDPADIPWCGIFISRETMIPDGDGNIGEPRFVADVTIAVSMVRGFDEASVLDGQIDADFAQALDLMLRDPTFVRFGDDALFESVERIETRRMFPLVAETYVCELRMEITFRTRVYFDPIVADDYERAVLTARPFNHPDAPAVTVTIDQAQDD